MLTRILFVGLMAGVLAGLAVAALQHFTTTPMILKAEALENAPAPAADGAAKKHQSSMMHDSGAHLILVHGDSHAETKPGAAIVWAPKDGLERTAYTTLTTVGAAVGFALILLAAMVLASESITMTTGIAWGAAAFVATGLAPAFGIAPELPGAAAVAVEFRQVWWAMTAVVTAAGLACILRAPGALTKAAGVALIALPHVIGAPHPHELTSPVPAELAANFATAALGVQAVLWALIGAGVGVFWQRGEKSA